MRKLKVALVGCGRISSVYRDAFQKLGNMIDLLYAVDIDQEKAADFAADFDKCKAVKNYDSILKENLDVIHLATPHHLHSEMAIKALRNNINVLTEKPIAINLQQADQMISAAKNTGNQLGVIFQTRYVDGCKKIKEIIQQGDLGKITNVLSYLAWSRKDKYYKNSDWKGTWDKEGGGVLINQAIHSIDRVQWLIGDDVEWIRGNIATRTHNVAVEDVAEATIKFKKGAIYQLYATNSFAYNRSIDIELVGEKGRAGLRKDKGWIELDNAQKTEINSKNNENVGEDYWGNSHIYQLKSFYKSVLNNKKVEIDGISGKKALEIIRGIYKSSRERKKIYLPFSDNN